MYVPGPSTPLSIEQLEQSALAESQGLFKDVTPAMLFSAQSDSILAARVLRLHPQLYRSLRLEMRYLNKELKRPDPNE